MLRAWSLAFLLFTACTDDDLGGPPPRHPLPIGTPSGVSDPGVDEPRCLIDSGLARLGAAGHDELRDVVITPTGRILVAGSENGSTTATGHFTGSRGMIVEYSRDLATWNRRAVLSTGSTDSFEALATAPETGQVWAAARTAGAIPGLQTRGGFDVVVGTLDSQFRPMTRGFESTSEFPARLALGPDGLLAVAGYEERATIDGRLAIHPFLATFDATAMARPLWLTTRRASDESYGPVAVSADSVFVAMSVAAGEERGTSVLARDHDAERRWRYPFSTNPADTIASLQVLPEGDVVWAATKATELGDTDIVVGRLDGVTGLPRFVVQLGTGGDDRVVDLKLDTSGRIHVAASTSGSDGRADPLLLTLDAEGRELAREQWRSPGNDVPTALAVDTCGGVAIVGHTDGDFAGPPNGGRDAFVLVTRR
jgi:hypothetical protein